MANNQFIPMSDTKEVEYPWAKLNLTNYNIFNPKYESSIVTKIQTIVKKGNVCIDIGAHQGIHTTLLSKLVGNTGLVHAFEPHPRNYQLLLQNLKNNGCTNVVTHNEALGNEVGMTVLHEWAGPSSNSGRGHLGKRRGPQGGPDFEVAINKLDNHKITEKVDFIKIDVEFWEAEVLRGATALVAREKPTILVEAHDLRNDSFVRTFALAQNFQISTVDDTLDSETKHHYLLSPTPNKMESGSPTPSISTIVLSFNRLNLLKKSIESYLSTISVPYELIIVDNKSSDGSREYIANVCDHKPNHKAILLDEDTGGGEAINLGLQHTRGEFIHISENDIEYFAGWDRELLRKFESFPKLGQLSPKSLSPGARQSPELITSNGDSVLVVEWITTTSIFRRSLLDLGLGWRSIKSTPGSKFRPPDDVKFSRDVGKAGFIVAWNDKNTVFNWGFSFKELIDNIDYYVENHKSKWADGLERLRSRLREKGYDLVEENGKYRAIQTHEPS